MNINKTKKYFFLLLIGFFYQTAQAGFEPPVIIDPPNPMEGDTIQVGLFKEHYFPCLLLPMENMDGETHLFDFDNALPQYPENHIDLIVVTMPIPLCVPFPVSPAPREYYELGQLPAGNYSLRTGYVGQSTSLPPNEPPLQYGEILTFSVSKALVSVDTTSNIALFTMTFFILILTLFRLKRTASNIGSNIGDNI